MSLIHFFKLVDVQARMTLRSDAAKYYLGYVWWILEPLLYVGVFYVVFNLILKNGRGDFLAFLMCGKMPFVWFSKSVNQASNSIASNAGLIGKVNVPKTLFPMVVVQEGIYRQVAVFTLLLCVLVSMGYQFAWGWLWILPVVFVQYLMIVACALIGATLVCYARDIGMLISLAMIFLMFTSGVFWDVNALPSEEMSRLILVYNPLAFILDCYRRVLMYQGSPDLTHLFIVGLISILLIVFAVTVMEALSQRIALRVLSS